MSFVESLAKLRLLVVKPRTPLVSYLTIRGPITTDTTSEVNELLKKVPRETKKLAAIVNSSGGEISQAYIIAEKLKKKAKELNVQLITCAEQFALNSAYYILSQGNTIIADRSTFIGGIEVGQSKTNLGCFSQYLKTVVYSEDKSYEAELKKDGPFSQEKAAEMRQLFSLFSQDLRARILAKRENKSDQIDLNKFYDAEEAKNLGLIDHIGGIYTVLPQILRNPQIVRVRESQLKQFMNDLKKVRKVN